MTLDMQLWKGLNSYNRDDVQKALIRGHDFVRQTKARLNDLTYGRAPKAIPRTLSENSDEEEEVSGDEFEDTVEDQSGGGSSRRGSRA